MLHTLAVANYRSINSLILPLGRLNLITGANGSGKSNLYRVLRLLAETAQGGVVNALAREGGLESSFWAGPVKISRRMLVGEVPVQGGPRQNVIRLRLGFAGEDFGYAIALGLPEPSSSAFALDPEIKRECIWAGASYRPASLLVDRTGPMVRMREGRSWQVLAQHVPNYDSLFDQIGNDPNCPEVFQLRETIRRWRFYDHFRSDAEAPARQPQLGTRTPVLHHDGRELAAALQTIRVIGDRDALDAAFYDAFPRQPPAYRFSGRRALRRGTAPGRFAAPLERRRTVRRHVALPAAVGRPAHATAAFTDGAQTSLHPDLLPALGRLIIAASKQTQVWVVSHASRLIATLKESPNCNTLELDKQLGKTCIRGQGMLDEPPWHWPD